MLKKLEKIAEKEQYKFKCETCNYLCSKKSNFEKHLLTKKHNARSCSKMLTENSQYECECGNIYKHKQSFIRHKKNCTFEDNNEINKINENNEIITLNNENTEELKELVCKLLTENKELQNTLIKENQELRSQITELIPKVGNNNNTTINNQKFNIQVFLNEKCKDAINISDFIKSIEISLEQLDVINKKGLALGLSSAIMENMNKLSLYERPMHCTDVKRETLYIKDENKWEKDKSKEKIKEAIKKASNKNYNALQCWKKENPDFLENDDKQYEFAHIISEIGKPINNVHEKIIKKLCNETYVKDS